MIKNSLVGGAYPVRKAGKSAPQTSPLPRPRSGFIVAVLLSLGLWWAIWDAFSSFFFG